VVRGAGFSFSAPAGWRTSRTPRSVAASDGRVRVSVSTYTLQKPYRPALFSAAARELDGVVAKLAASAGRKLSERRTIEVAGRKIRAYRFGTVRIGFVLVGTREYQLLCKLTSSGSDPAGACALLFSSFSVS
jgi:hypothetical protein